MESGARRTQEALFPSPSPTFPYPGLPAPTHIPLGSPTTANCWDTGARWSSSLRAIKWATKRSQMTSLWCLRPLSTAGRGLSLREVGTDLPLPCLCVCA